MDPILSVVIPVYNVRDYINNCVTSVLNQAFQNIEIILVDDGSTDGSSVVCDKLAAKDPRIRVIHQENMGLSGARNTGILHSKGKYIAFVDGDDMVTEQGLYRMLEKSLKFEPDIIVGKAKQIIHNKVSPFGRQSKLIAEGIYSGKEFLKKALKNNAISMSACLNLYNRSFLRKLGIYFKEGILHEDEYWTPQIFLNASKVYYTDEYFYIYVKRESSITTKKNKLKNATDLINTCYELSSIYSQIDDQDLKILLQDYLAMLYLNAFFIGRLHLKQGFVADKKFVLEKAHSFRNKLKAKLFALSPFFYCNLNLMFKTFRSLYQKSSSLFNDMIRVRWCGKYPSVFDKNLGL